MSDVKKIKESVVARQLKELSGEVARDEADYPGKDEITEAIFELGRLIESGNAVLAEEWLAALKLGIAHAGLLERLAAHIRQSYASITG